MSTANGGLPHVENGGGPEEADEAELQGMSRMLNDGKGRMRKCCRRKLSRNLITCADNCAITQSILETRPHYHTYKPSDSW